MIHSSPSARAWRQLLALTFTHAIADTYVGIIAPILIPMRDRYGLPLSGLIFIASLLGFSSNIFQIPVGHLRATWRSPILIVMGVLLAGLTVLIPTLPVTALSPVWMSLLALLAGFGVATVHPEGLRALHGIHHISSSLTTAIFMVSGFMGFAGGALLSATLTDCFGLNSLRWLYLAAPIAAVVISVCGLRLPIETPVSQVAAPPPTRPENIPGLAFGPLFLMAAILATCSQIQATLLPSYLHEEAGYSLSFSGLSFTLFGVGGTVGAILWGLLAPRFGHLRILLFSSLVGAPLTAIYLFCAPYSTAAAWLLILTGFIVYTGFPLCITLARYADSRLRFGTRMGLASGGSWAIAAIALWILGPLTPHTGIGPLLHLIWIGYLGTAGLTWHLMRHSHR